MEKLDRYRQVIKQILTEQAELSSVGDDNVEPQLIFDDTHDHYQLNYVGWRGNKRVFGPVMHFDIKNGKIWLQYNGTEDSIAKKLTDMDVPNTDIVLGLHSEFKRQFTPYAVS